MMSLKAFDAFPKINEDFNRRTLAGGVITLGAALIMSALFLNELGRYLVYSCTTRISSPCQAPVERRAPRACRNISHHRDRERAFSGSVQRRAAGNPCAMQPRTCRLIGVCSIHVQHV